VEPETRGVKSLRPVAGLVPKAAPIAPVTGALNPRHPPEALHLLPLAEIESRAATAWGRPVPFAVVKQLAEATGGVPWIVHLVLGSTIHDGDDPLSGPLDLRGMVDDLGYELETVPADLRDLLVALAVGFDAVGRLPSSLGESVGDLVERARTAGLLLPDGRLVPVVRHALLATTPAYRLRPLQHQLVDAALAEGLSLEDVAERLAHAGLRDSRVASTLERAGDGLLGTQPAVASALYEDAEAAGSDALATAARRAQAASAVGDLDGAARILDDLLAHEDVPDLARAVDVAAAVWAGRGMLERSAEIYRWLGPARAGSSAPLAAVAMLGVGDRNGADAMLNAAPADGTPTMVSVAVDLMGRGLRQSVDSASGPALPSLIRASDMMTATGLVAPLPEIPAVLAAMVALHSAELAVADSVIERALTGGQGGAVARPRLLLLRAWVAMQAERSDLAQLAIRQATADARGLAPRDELFLRALELGLARRADDAPSLVHAWQRARESILHVPIDLFSLMPLGELVMAATRVGDSAWLDTPLAEAWGMLGKLGNPPLWSVPLHWSVVQSAILADRPSDAAPHAAALVKASGQSHLASVLSGAGRVWIAVRARRFQVAAVEEAARGLASVGLPWDGSRLAGHAAAHTEERKDMARLLACARELHPADAPMSASVTASEAAAAAAPGSLGASRGRAGPMRDETGLSAREREVARLVLEGNTYGEIGEAIFISPRTVEHHVARIRRQLGVATRSEMLAQLRYVLGSSDTPPE
jgi:DNA-binding CsgD family transcriptional regulator